MLRTESREKSKSGKLGVVIVAAGSSQRMGGVNKLFASLRGKPLLAWSVDVCQEFRLAEQIVLVLNDQDLLRGRGLKAKRGWSRVTLCSGGARRQDSVKRGLRRIEGCDWVAIHDAARPFITPKLIEDGLEAAKKTMAAVAAVPVKDTVKVAGDGRLIRETLPRERLWAAQTPQIFSLRVITAAYDNLEAEVTDDSAAVELLGHKVKLYVGDYSNLKVTTPDDLVLARMIAKEWKQKS